MTKKHLLRLSTSLLTLLAATTLGRSAFAGLPEMEDTLAQRANSEWFDQCPNGSTTGVACAGTVCGVDFVLDAAAVQRFITIDGNAYDLHSGNGDDFAVAGLLNAVCNGTAAMTTAATGLQSMLGADVMLFGRLRGGMGMGRGMAPGTDAGTGTGASTGMVTTDPGPMLRAGGAIEIGNNGSYTGIIPISYAHSFSRDEFVNLNGALSYAFMSEGSFFKLNAIPSFGKLGGDSRLSWGAGAYAPLSFSHVAISLIDYSMTGYDVGAGGVGIVDYRTGPTHIAGGAVIDVRHSNMGGTQLPMTALFRILHPVSLVDAFGSVSVGSNPIYSGTTSASLRLGAEWGKWEFGYQLSLATGYMGHMLGFMYREELRRQEVLQRPPAETKPAPEGEAAK